CDGRCRGRWWRFQRSWVNRSKGKLHRILGRVRMIRAGKHAELRQHLPGEAVLREHALHSVLDDEFRMANPLLGQLAVALAADETGEEHVAVLLLLLARDRDLFGIDHNDKVTGVDVGRVGRLVAAAEDVRDLDGKAAKDLALGIDEIPLGLHGLLLGEESLHEKRGLELGFAGTLSTRILKASTREPPSGREMPANAVPRQQKTRRTEVAAGRSD